jgi:hypothetical protein
VFEEREWLRGANGLADGDWRYPSHPEWPRNSVSFADGDGAAWHKRVLVMLEKGIACLALITTVEVPVVADVPEKAIRVATFLRKVANPAALLCVPPRLGVDMSMRRQRYDEFIAVTRIALWKYMGSAQFQSDE